MVFHNHLILRLLRDSNDSGLSETLLDRLTKGSNEKANTQFVYVYQHGGTNSISVPTQRFTFSL